MAEEKKHVSYKKIEGVGYVYVGIFRGEDVWGKWHEDYCFCIIKTEDGKYIDVGNLMSEIFGAEYTYCGMSNQGYKCPEESEYAIDCPYRDNSGICRPRLFRFEITVRAQSLEDRYPCLEENATPEMGVIEKETETLSAETAKEVKKVKAPLVPDIKDMVKTLFDLIMQLREVKYRHFKKYICFYIARPDLKSLFAVLIPTKTGITIRVRADPSEIKDTRELTKKVSKKWFFTAGQGEEIEFIITSKTEIDYALNLIKKSYELANYLF
jgi:predicted transport protein